MENLSIMPSPHINHPDSTKGIMADVLIALLPASVAGCILFGWKVLLVIAVAVVTAVAAEFVCCTVMKRPTSIGYFSAVVTGLILALSVPPSIPLWMVAIGSFVAIVVVKQLFGGLGANFVNPAMTARIVLAIFFPTAMRTWTAPLGSVSQIVSDATTVGEAVDIVTAATPLSDTALAGNYYSYTQLFLGQTAGCIGETAAVFIVIGALYLFARRVITPVIPVSFIGTVALMSWIFGLDPLYMILSGGLLFSAFFVATDYVTSPVGWIGQSIYGIGRGLITFIIRRFIGIPEGVAYAILIMNLLALVINKITLPKPFGSPRTCIIYNKIKKVFTK